jgi:hypothetical protein
MQRRTCHVLSCGSFVRLAEQASRCAVGQISFRQVSAKPVIAAPHSGRSGKLHMPQGACRWRTWAKRAWCHLGLAQAMTTSGRPRQA